MQKLSLDALAREQLDAARRSSAGRAAHTVVGGHERVLRHTVIAMQARRSLAEHDNPGKATVHVLRGRVRLVAGQHAWEGRPGDLIVVPPQTHRLDALEDTAVLLTVAKIGVEVRGRGKPVAGFAEFVTMRDRAGHDRRGTDRGDGTVRVARGAARYPS